MFKKLAGSVRQELKWEEDIEINNMDVYIYIYIYDYDKNILMRPIGINNMDVYIYNILI